MSRSKNAQLSFLKKDSLSYGGELLKTRAGRSRGRPLDTKSSMHLILRSSKARGEWSFKKPKNERAIEQIVEKFSRKYGVEVLSLGNVGNHLHFHIKLARRQGYKPFIRAITAAIMMKVTGVSRWSGGSKERFWDLRPFTRIIKGYKAFLALKDYIALNMLEGRGAQRVPARTLIANYGGDFARRLLHEGFLTAGAASDELSAMTTP